MRKLLSPILAVALVLLASAALYLSYLAGCAGDTKGGALGNPLRALELEGVAFCLVVLATLFAPAVAFRLLPGSGATKFSVSLVVGVFVFTCLYLIGIQAEFSGVQACFRQ